MRITKIEIEGDSGSYAAISRRRGDASITVELLKSAVPNGITRTAKASDADAIFAIATWLQRELDGHRGTNSMVHDYYRELQRLADC